jgi:lysophospholipid acyltransferase 5
MAQELGVAPAAVSLITALLAATALALGWRILPRSPILRHAYSALGGIWVVWLAYGDAALAHSLVAILYTWVLLFLFPTRLALPLAGALNLAHLLLGYHHCLDPYGTPHLLNWTVCQCVLTLRLIGLSFDVSDGGRDPDTLDADGRERRLAVVPSLLQTLGYAYHFGGVLVGPQFPFHRYRAFVDGRLVPAKRPPSVRAILQCLLGGLLYLALHLVLAAYLPPGTVLAAPYLATRPLALRVLEVTLSCRGFFYKYIGIWKLGEIANVLSGFAYNPDPAAGGPWAGLANARLRGFEFATQLRYVIDSFNVTTNHWAKLYVYKRLKFLNSKSLSAFLTVTFLALGRPR